MTATLQVLQSKEQDLAQRIIAAMSKLSETNSRCVGPMVTARYFATRPDEDPTKENTLEHLTMLRDAYTRISTELAEITELLQESISQATAQSA